MVVIIVWIVILIIISVAVNIKDKGVKQKHINKSIIRPKELKMLEGINNDFKTMWPKRTVSLIDSETTITINEKKTVLFNCIEVHNKEQFNNCNVESKAYQIISLNRKNITNMEKGIIKRYSKAYNEYKRKVNELKQSLIVNKGQNSKYIRQFEDMVIKDYRNSFLTISVYYFDKKGMHVKKQHYSVKMVLDILKLFPENPQKYSPLQVIKNYIPVDDVPGVYIIHNLSNDMYYVGQSQRVITRLRQHFLGNGGNADVYADYKYGDEFDIEIHLLSETNMSLDRFEAQYIAAYDCVNSGYNKTRGNINSF